MGRSKLVARRRQQGLSQEGLAQALTALRTDGDRRPVATTTVAAWEKGASTPRPWWRRPLAQALDVTLDELDELLVTDSSAPTSTTTPPATASLRADVQHVVELSDRYGADDVLPLALRLTKTGGQHNIDTEMLAAIAEASEVAGWVAFDAGQPELARRLDHEAITVARLAGDRQLEIFTLSNLAMLDVTHGRPAEALAIANHVLADHPGGNVAAMFRLREARAHALAGDRPAALRALARAEASIGDDGPWWAYWVTTSELEWHRGATYGDLGDWPAAADAFLVSLEQSASDGRRRSIANTQAALADAQQRAGDLAGLEVSLGQLIGYSDVTSGRNTAVLRDLVARLRRSPAPSTVSDAADQLARLITSPAGHRFG